MAVNSYLNDIVEGKQFYYMAESVFAMRLVNLRSIYNLLYGPKFQQKCSFRSSKSLYLGKKVEIKLQDVYQP